MAESCDICGREGPVDLFSSGCAPITYAGCPECRVRGAEELGVAGLWYLLEGGGAAAEALLAAAGDGVVLCPNYGDRAGGMSSGLGDV